MKMNMDRVLTEQYEKLEGITEYFAGLRAICQREGDGPHEILCRDVYLVLLFAKRLLVREVLACEGKLPVVPSEQ